MPSRVFWEPLFSYSSSGPGSWWATIPPPRPYSLRNSTLTCSESSSDVPKGILDLLYWKVIRLFGYQIVWSDMSPRRRHWTRPQTTSRRNTRELSREMRRIDLDNHQWRAAPSHNTASLSIDSERDPLPNWRHIQRLTAEAEGLLAQQQMPREPVFLVLAALTLLAFQVNPAYAINYWALFPNPPNFYPVTWHEDPIKVYTNASSILGGPSIPDTKVFVTALNKNFTYTGISSSLPICFTFPMDGPFSIPSPNCVSTQFSVAIHDGVSLGSSAQTLKRRALTAVFPGSNVSVVRAYPFESVQDISKYYVHPSVYPDCKPFVTYIVSNSIRDSCPLWVECMFNSTRPVLLKENNNSSVQDWSLFDPLSDYRNYYLGKYGWSESFMPSPILINCVSTQGFIVPILVSQQNHSIKFHSHIWKLLFATCKATYQFSSEKIQFYNFIGCVTSPFALLMTKNPTSLQIKKQSNTYSINCKECILSN
uniref:Uncharacterized protein n=1 Tax=Suricata suricatta TaxID=37032 RepID=A0A673URD3_SURSU